MIGRSYTDRRFGTRLLEPEIRGAQRKKGKKKKKDKTNGAHSSFREVKFDACSMIKETYARGCNFCNLILRIDIYVKDHPDITHHHTFPFPSPFFLLTRKINSAYVRETVCACIC